MQIFKIVLGLLLGVLVYGFINFDQELNTAHLLLSGLVGVLLAFLTHSTSSLLDSRVGWKKQTGARLLFGIVIHTLVAIAVIKLSFLMITNTNLLKVSILVLSFSVVYSTIYFIFYSYYQYSKNQVRQMEFETKQTQLQFDALKSQLSPHFLFNSLNALSALYYKDLKSAECFIRSLATSYSYVLSHYENTLVSVKDEVSFTQSYFDMMAIRFGPNLSLSTSIPPEILETQIPPLTLQMLVENAIKHNCVDGDHRLKIRIIYADGSLCVVNNKLSKPAGRKSANVGLSNISERFVLLGEKAIRVNESEDFTVALPIIR